MSDWETYWKGVNSEKNDRGVFWDSSPERAAKEDLSRFKTYMDPSIPLLDLGCGNGRQTRYLAQHFSRVIGVDVSESAIDLAKSEADEKVNVEYRIFDALDTNAASRLHDELGDSNIYMRGVLHMVGMHDRPRFIDSLAILLGKKGTLYQIELPLKAYFYLRTLSPDAWSMFPKLVRRVGFDLEEAARHFPEDAWIVIDQGNDVTVRSAPFGGGREAAVPANYLVLRTNLSESWRSFHDLPHS